MKLLAGILLFFTHATYAQGFHCMVTEVEHYQFGEDLDIKGGTYTFGDAGDVWFEHNSGNKKSYIHFGNEHLKLSKNHFEISEGKTYKRYVFNDAFMKIQYQVRIYNKSKKGILLGRLKNKWELIAEMDCADYTSQTEALSEASVGDERVTRIYYKDIAKKIWAVMATVDLEVDMGDGYYSLKKSKHFQVRDDKGTVVGYIEEAELEYSEGDDPTVYVKYLPNGVRVFGPHDW